MCWVHGEKMIEQLEEPKEIQGPSQAAPVQSSGLKPRICRFDWSGRKTSEGIILEQMPQVSI